jgi:hypothetical protein
MRRQELQARARPQQSGGGRSSDSGAGGRRRGPHPVERDRRHRGERGPITVNLTSCLGLTVLTLIVLSYAGVIDLNLSESLGLTRRGESESVERDDAAAGAGGVGEAGGVLEDAAAAATASPPSRCHPALARDDTWGTYASVPAFDGLTPEEELQSLTLAIDSTPDGGSSLGALETTAPTTPHLTQYQRAMQTLRLPVDCRVETGDAMTRAEDGGEEREHPKLGSCAIVFPSVGSCTS